MFDWLPDWDLTYLLDWWAYLLGLGLLSFLGVVIGAARLWINWKANHGRRIRITYRIREELIDRLHPFHLPLQVTVANHTGATVYREHVYILPRDGQRLPPVKITQDPPPQGKNRPLPDGHSLIATFEIMWLSEQLLVRGYRGSAFVRFVFATPQKDHTKWIWIRDLNRWARDQIVQDVTEQDRREGRWRWYPRWFGR